MQDSGIDFKNTLKKHTLFYNLLHDIVKKLQEEIKTLEKLRLDPELTLLTCNLIENSIPKANKFDIDKKQLAIQILSPIFNLTSEEQTIISQQIDFLHSNNKIKKVNFFKNAKNFLSELLIKKLL